MARTASSDTRRSPLSRRTQIVWASFVSATALVVAVLALGDDRSAGGYVATSLTVVGSGAGGADPVFDIDAPVDRRRWSGIVIHHLGVPAGDPQSVHRQHRSFGYQGLGYHFLIGNGNGLGDGVVHVGYRWNRQLPGAHTVGPDSEHHNERSIGICLVGNGDLQPFTDRQMVHLSVLVRRLCDELDLPLDAVRLHRDVASAVSSPGRYFPEDRFLRDIAEPLPR